MSRTLKRVPFDFKWPKNQVWKGYLNPYHSQECKACDGSGLNPETKKLSDDWYCFDRVKWISLSNGKRYNDLAWQYHLTEIEVGALLREDRLWDFTRIPITEEQKEIVKQKVAGGENSWLPESNGYIPTPEEVNKWAKHGMGHDAINQWICVKARAEHLGIYGHCEYCNGEGHYWQTEEAKKLHEDWEPFEPPTGAGYQLWETCSEGSPVSPIFKSLGELCEWAENNATTFANFKATAKEWKEMLERDFVTRQEGNVVFM